MQKYDICWNIYQIRIPTQWKFIKEKDCFETKNRKALVRIVRYHDEYCLQLLLKSAVGNDHYPLCDLRSKDFSKGKLEILFKKGIVWLNFYCDDEEKNSRAIKR